MMVLKTWTFCSDYCSGVVKDEKRDAVIADAEIKKNSSKVFFSISDFV
jgi:hypothetical protein